MVKSLEVIADIWTPAGGESKALGHTSVSSQLLGQRYNAKNRGVLFVKFVNSCQLVLTIVQDLPIMAAKAT